MLLELAQQRRGGLLIGGAPLSRPAEARHQAERVPIAFVAHFGPRIAGARIWAGIHRSTGRFSSPLKPAGADARDREQRVLDAQLPPTIAGSPANVRRHNPWLRTTDGSAATLRAAREESSG